MSTLILGAHLSIAGGVQHAAEEAGRLGCNALQIFVKSPNRWEGRNIRNEEAAEFKKLVDKYRIIGLAAHSSYLINLASPDEKLHQKSIAAVLGEMEQCSRLGIPYLVIHPGSPRDQSVSQGIKNIVKALHQVLEEGSENVNICLETTSGQGNSIGHRFEHLREIIAGVAGADRARVCLDTCHIFSAGYDIRTADTYRNTMDSFNKTIGFERLSLFHLNDSLHPLGSRKDRHQHIGRGELGDEAFFNLINDPRFEKISKILETPKDRNGTGDRENLAKLRNFHQRAGLTP